MKYNIENPKWPAATQQNPCPECGRTNNCLIAPDGKAGKCWRNGGQVWHDGNNGHALGAGGNGQARLSGNGQRQSYTTAIQAIEAIEYTTGGKQVAVYAYRDANGGDVAKVVRLATPDGKAYRPLYRHKTGWRIGDPPGKWPVYRRAELPTTGPVYIVEGEKCTNLAAMLGLAAVTSAHGSVSAGKTDWESLAGRDVVILPDNDDAGRKYADDVCKLLLALDPPATVKVVNLPGLPNAGDIEQFIEAGGTRADVERLADQVERVNPADVIGGPVLRCLADVKPEPIRWLWPGRIALGKNHLLFGDPGLGKSFLTLDLAARVSTGAALPDGSGNAPLGSVILLNCEDDLADTIRPRLNAAGADASRIVALEAIQRPGEGGKMIERSFTLDDLPMLEDAVKRTPGVKLVVIDPISAYLGKSDSHKNAEIRGLLAPLSKLASDYQLAVVMVTHMSKGDGKGMYRAMGSLAFIAAARSAWAVAKDKDNPKRRLLLPAKNNIGNDETGLAYCIIDGAVVWEPGPVTQKLDDVLSIDAGHRSLGPNPEKRDTAAEWLIERLKDGPVYVGNKKNPEPGTIRADAEAAGMAWRTVRRAMEELGVRSERCPLTKRYRWRLPKSGCPTPPNTNNVDNLDNQHFSTGKSPISLEESSGCPSYENTDNQSRERGEV